VNAGIVERTVARHFDIRQNVIVPNVYWGIGLSYEADVVVLRPSGYAVEVEIKVSASDIKADLKKSHCHDSKLFKELWFAVPECLEAHPDIPARAGVLSIVKVEASSWYLSGYKVKRVRSPETNKTAVKWSDRKRLSLCRLATMRCWDLKDKLAALMREQASKEAPTNDH